MSGAPKKIWAIHHKTQGAVMIGEWADTVRHAGGVEYTLTAEVEAMIREAVQAERDACEAIIEDMKSEAAIEAASRARYTAMQTSNAAFNECRHRIRGRIAWDE